MKVSIRTMLHKTNYVSPGGEDRYTASVTTNTPVGAHKYSPSSLLSKDEATEWLEKRFGVELAKAPDTARIIGGPTYGFIEYEA